MRLEGLDLIFKGFILSIVLVIVVILYGGISLYKSFKPQIVESKKVIYPKIKLETDGKTTDTIYVYRFE